MNPRWSLVVTLGLTAPLAAQSADWTVKNPTSVRQTGSFRDSRITESSGVVPTSTAGGVFWTLNDSGNEPLIFAVDTAGVTRATFRIAGATNLDWEALSLGPCGDRRCLYIGDTGDFQVARRPTVTIYRVVEPTLPSPAGETPLLDSLVIRYADGPRDVEALVVTPTGDIALINKGWREPVAVYWVPRESWTRGRVTARPIETLPIEGRLLNGSLVTDAALSPNGGQLAVRTYANLYVFQRGEHSRWLPDHPDRRCPIGGLEPQGEGVAWWDEHTLILTSERGATSSAPITLLECPRP